ncbi:tRNA 2-selenouridine(34) synthase MnmH [Frigidibacter sp. ROC022]|uniref:tRNA 2-selenouridine(34) synthase MnmH n=1 Tax=Frigidibacter sp. ROC022 TaxID=2971796 RepID=UPI00215B476F|nr:tRNA 2-selenouridine(34) synthase MnmH [Frigidibacter sp. ROC022]MCR8723757.1 tRNA 2-selenouridine(34) synthase MnmH [Frigidibacter sp. ROC022]
MIQLDSLSALGSLPFDEVIDVRSPAEFAEDHVPGAISLPVLSNAERAEVGTIYKQVDPFVARKVGAALVAKNAARHLQGPLADRPYRWRPLVYCWRGGQRSGSFASILAQIGWRADTIEGGYKAYRKLVVQEVYDRQPAPRLVLLDGNTGTAKTRLLALLAEAGAQVLDLEGLAEHRGSLFGGFGGLQAPQPSQKMFESRLAAALQGFDPAQVVFAEAEAAKIGDLLVPKGVWQGMLAAERIEISAPLAARADFLMQSYSDLIEDGAVLAARLDKLRPYHAAEVIEEWHGLAAAGSFHALAQQLMALHYDPRYAKAAERRRPPVARVALERLDDAALRAAVPKILAAARV